MYKIFKPKCVRVDIQAAQFPPKIIQSALLVIKDGNILHPRYRPHNAEVFMKMTPESYEKEFKKLGYQIILDIKYPILSNDFIVN